MLKKGWKEEHRCIKSDVKAKILIPTCLSKCSINRRDFRISFQLAEQADTKKRLVSGNSCVLLFFKQALAGDSGPS